MENAKNHWEIANWEREKPRRLWDPSRMLLKTLRNYQRVSIMNNFYNIIFKKFYVLLYRFWSVVTGADIPLNTKIAGGLLIPHPNGIVIHPDCQIGCNCLIFQQVTLANEVIVGYHVDIGAGAKILGPIVIGNNVRIGANAVVTENVPSNTTVAGIPAVPIRSSL